MSSGVIIMLVAIALFIGYLIGRQNQIPQKAAQTFTKASSRDLSRQDREEILALLRANRDGKDGVVGAVDLHVEH